MTTLAFPTFTRALPYTQWEFGQVPNTFVHTSPLSGQIQTVEMPGTRWVHSLRLEGLTTAERQMMSAWLAQLRGRANRYTLWDVINPVPKGTMRGTVVAFDNRPAGSVTCSIDAGSGQAGTTLLRGDKLNIAGELKIVLNTVGLDGAGRVWIDVEPPFRNAVSAGASVTWDRPTALFVRTEDDWRMGHTAPRYGTVALDGVEAFA